MILDKFNKLHINNTRKVLLILNHNFSTKKSEKIKLFWENEIVHKANLTYDLLTNEEKQIHNLHEEAVSKGHFTYHDPKTNERILTRLRHYLRGKCCGNACRHCVYGHENVFDEQKLKVRRFNSSFWSYPEEKPEVMFDDTNYFNGSNIKHKIRPSPSMRFDFSRA